MARLTRIAGSLALLALFANASPAASEKAIDAAIKGGTDFLRGQFRGGPLQSTHGIGPAALAGIALLEAKVPANDPAVMAITKAVREASYAETKTYQLVLCLIFMDQLEDPADIPLIQMLGARLVASQLADGGWNYNCGSAVSQETNQWLRSNLKGNQLVAGKGDPNGDPRDTPKSKLHPSVEKYLAALIQNREAAGAPSDNSNTQFGLLGSWICRKHGVPVEATLDKVEKHFLLTQNAAGGWGYGQTSRSFLTDAGMTCSGLMGLSTGLARHKRKPVKAAPPKKKGKPAQSDPFFNSPASGGEKPGGKSSNSKIPLNPAAIRALNCLGLQLAGKVRANFRSTDLAVAPTEGMGSELYFLWSMERVGVIYGVDRFGGLDWYAIGSDLLVKTQERAGCWGSKSGEYGPEVCTCFALLFLLKADLARDLSSRFKNSKDNELRAGTSGAAPSGGSSDSNPRPKNPGSDSGGSPLPSPVEDQFAKQANLLLRSSATEWTKGLEKYRDAKGGDNTKVLVAAIHRAEGPRMKQAREALAERLTRMSARTLRGMMKSEDAELRRGAVLAAAMKDEKAHVPDLIDRLTDESDSVVRAARAGLKSLTSQDFGPKSGATEAECKAAANAWKAWWAKQKR